LKSQRHIYFVVKSIFLIAVAFLIINACVVPVDLNFPASDGKLVVDGYITNVEKEHLVRLSYSSGFDNNGIWIPSKIDNAFVVIVDDNGNRTPLVNREPGDYYTPMFKAEPDRSYKIEVQVDGESYQSSFQQLPAYSESTKIRYEPSERQVFAVTTSNIRDQKGVGIYVSIDRVNEPVYYNWVQKNFKIYQARHGRGENERLDSLKFPNITCYIRNFDRIQLDIFNNHPNNPEGPIEIDLDFIESSTFQYFDFSIQVIQLITNQESYDYWNSIKDAIDNVGSIFDPAPYSIPGNIKKIDNTQVLGFFGVYNETSSRIFYYNCDLPLTYRSPQENCPRITVSNHNFLSEEDAAARLAAAEMAKLTSGCYDCLYADGNMVAIRSS